MKKILLAGSTGYLGIYIAKELQRRSYFFRAIARSPEKLAKNDIEANETLKAELTDPNSIKNVVKVSILLFQLLALQDKRMA